MKKSVIIILGLGLMVFGCESPSKDGGGEGGSGGSGGAGGAAPCTDSAECDDDNVCTVNVCDEGQCANLPADEDTTCMFMGGPGLCSEGACAPFCDVEDCSDGNDCTKDICDSMLGTCSNSDEPDDTTCMVGIDTGLCKSGVCVALCEGKDCDDTNECTDDSCNPEDGMCIHAPRTLQSCDFDGGGPLSGRCNDADPSVCEDAGMCAGKACSDGNECTVDLCDPPTGDCANDPVDNETSCGGGEGTCTDKLGRKPDETLMDADWCQLAANEFLAVDCELLGNSAPLPVDAKVRALGIAFADQPVDVVIDDAIIVATALVCNFIEADFTSTEVDNSVVTNAVSNASITNAALNSFLVDGSADNARVSPHDLVSFDFATACGCPDPTNPPDPDTCGTGPGIVAPAFVRDGASETIPPGPTPFPITPTAAGTVDFTVAYSGLALQLKDLMGPFIVPVVCVGGGCPAVPGDICSPEDRGGIPSPRIMYDATCNKAQAGAGDCTPFVVFTDVADVCKGTGVDFADAPDCCDQDLLPGGVPGPNFDPNCMSAANIAACCAVLATDYPTATAAQQPRLPVSPAL